MITMKSGANKLAETGPGAATDSQPAAVSRACRGVTNGPAACREPPALGFGPSRGPGPITARKAGRRPGPITARQASGKPVGDKLRS
jgi:hypothetical protein